MGVLNTANNLNVGSTQVDAAYLSGVRVWPPVDGLWHLDKPAYNSPLSLTVKTFSNNAPVIDWGDGQVETLPVTNPGDSSPGSTEYSATHVYELSDPMGLNNTWNGALDIESTDDVHTFNSFRAYDIPFSGPLYVDKLTNAKNIHLSGHDAEFMNLGDNTTLVSFQNEVNNSTGKVLETIDNKLDLKIYNLTDTNYTGATHSTLPASNLDKYITSDSNLSGSLPNFGTNFHNLHTYKVDNNQLTGSIPSLVNIMKDYNNVYDSHTLIDLSNNQFSSLRAFENLAWSVNAKILQANFSNNLLASEDLEDILTEFDFQGAQSVGVDASTPPQQAYIDISNNIGNISQTVIDTTVSSLTAKGWVVIL